MIRTGVLALCGILLVYPVHADKEPAVSNLPPAVQERIKEWKGEGELKKVKTRKQKDGSFLYEVEVKERGDEKFAVFGADGSVISETDHKGKGKAKGKDKKKENKSEKRGKSDSANEIETEERRSSEQRRSAGDPNAQTTAPTSSRNQEVPVIRPGTSPSTGSKQGTVTTSPGRTNTVAKPSTQAARPIIDRSPGETRYIYWDNMPEPVRRMGLAQQAELGAVNAKLLRVQKKAEKSMYHIPYEKGSVSIDERGIVITPASQHGGPMNLVPWDDIPEAVKKAALSGGSVNANTVTYQTNKSRTLYHILFEKENVISYSQDGQVQDPASYWR